MAPNKEVIKSWVAAFNEADVEGLTSFYHDCAINHQVTDPPVEGKANIKEMFEREFANADMICIIENLFEDKEWVILEWKDPLGLRGCGFFKLKEGKILYQRGYWDKLTFLRQHKLPLPKE